MGPIILICFLFHALIKGKTKRKQNEKQKSRNPNADTKRGFYWRLQQFYEKKDVSLPGKESKTFPLCL